jgi:hypothetical protein
MLVFLVFIADYFSKLTAFKGAEQAPRGLSYMFDGEKEKSLLVVMSLELGKKL